MVTRMGEPAIEKVYTRRERALPNGRIVTLPMKFFNNSKKFTCLVHGNVVRFFYHDDEHSILEYVERGTLREVLFESSVELDWLTRKRMIFDIACGMAYLSRSKIEHIPFSDDKVLVADDFTCKISGIDCVRTEPQCTTGYEQVDTGARYECPERLRGEPHDTEKADVYKFGSLVYSILTRKRPFEDIKQVFQVLKLIGQGKTPQEHDPCPEDAPEDFVGMMQLCWQDEQNRPTFEQLVDLMCTF